MRRLVVLKFGCLTDCLVWMVGCVDFAVSGVWRLVCDLGWQLRVHGCLHGLIWCLALRWWVSRWLAVVLVLGCVIRLGGVCAGLVCLPVCVGIWYWFCSFWVVLAGA